MRKLGTLVWSISVCALIAGALILRAQDPSKVAANAFTEKINNDQVQVFEYRSKPGDKEAMHDHHANVVIAVAGGKIRFTTPDGKTQEREYKPGDVVFRPAGKHSGENVGTTEIHAYIVELKGTSTK